MTHMDLYKNIEQNFKTTEDSRVVVSKWCLPKNPYLPTIPPASAGRERERAAYFAITAERILWRKKILGIAVDAALADNSDILNSRPFGDNTPTLEELLAPRIAIAAALVPLTPPRGGEDDVKPVLARLYCIKGLAGHHSPPFADGKDTSGISTHSWFLAGVNDLDNATMIVGRSWLLAAHLLMRIVAKEDKPARENLARNFIVTGDVEEGQIIRVEMGRKLELAKRPAFRTLKWIMPTENANSAELENTMKNRIEKLATLEEAYELIESMRNRATRSFFRFLKESNLEGMKEQFANGADIYADDAETKKGALQLVAEKIAKEIANERKSLQGENSAESREATSKKIDTLNGIRSWLYLNGFAVANAKTIYAMAKNGMDKILEDLFLDVPIDARDEEGLTAVDWALLEKEWDLARLLHEHGGHCDVNGGNKALERAVETSRYDDEARTLVLNALRVGFDPDARGLFSSAIRKGDIELARACIEAGRTLNAKPSLENAILIVAEDETGNMSSQKQDEMINMLRQHIAAFSPEMIEKIKVAKARSLIHKVLARNNVDENLNKARRAIEDGILSINVQFEKEWFDGFSCPYYYECDLFALSLKEGWGSIVEACLEKGASPIDYITYFEGPEYGIVTGRPKNKKKEPYDPISFVMESKELSSTQKKDILALLRKYWPQGQPLPKNAFL